MGAKFIHGVYLPEREDYLATDVLASLPFGGGGTVQFKKFRAAFAVIKNFRHAVDIGANAGIWTRTLSRCFAKVTAFEPNPECFDAWGRNNPGHDPSSEVILLRMALGHEQATIRLNNRRRSTGFTHVDPDGDLEVEQTTLDSLKLQDVDFIKIDVEGWEHNVIKGAAQTIAKFRPTLILEQKPHNAEQHGLKQYGARNLLLKMGAREVANISGDIIMDFPK